MKLSSDRSSNLFHNKFENNIYGTPINNKINYISNRMSEYYIRKRSNDSFFGRNDKGNLTINDNLTQYNIIENESLEKNNNNTKNFNTIKKINNYFQFNKNEKNSKIKDSFMMSPNDSTLTLSKIATNSNLKYSNSIKKNIFNDNLIKNNNNITKENYRKIDKKHNRNSKTPVKILENKKTKKT